MTLNHLPRRPRLRPAAALAAAVAIVALIPCRPAAAQAPGADSILRDFALTGDYLLEIDGAPADGAKIYRTDRVAALLLVSSKLPEATLLSPRAGTVETVSLMKLARRDDGTLDILADAQLTPAGRFTIDGEDVRFVVDGKTAVLKPRPYLLALHPGADLLDYKPEYKRDAAAYSPDPKAVASMLDSGTPVRVRVYFGSWCPACAHWVPPLLKVAEKLDGSKIQFEFYGLPRPFDDDAAAKADGVHSIPTAIVYMDGKEVGRLNGAPAWRYPELTLDDIVHGRYAGN